MTILCPKEYHQAVQHALDADDALAAAAYVEKDEKKARSLDSKRGQATKTLLACFGYRAQSDHQDNLTPYFPESSEVRHLDGSVRTIHDLGPDNLPLRETFIFSDFAPYSFFFRELYLDRQTRQQVEVYDRCWYVFKDGTTQEEANRMTDDELDACVGKDGVRRVFDQHAVDQELDKDESTVYVERMKRRVGMCGGIIYHADYADDGQTKCPYGSYSTHT